MKNFKKKNLNFIFKDLFADTGPAQIHRPWECVYFGHVSDLLL